MTRGPEQCVRVALAGLRTTLQDTGSQVEGRLATLTSRVWVGQTEDGPRAAPVILYRAPSPCESPVRQGPASWWVRWERGCSLSSLFTSV